MVILLANPVTKVDDHPESYHENSNIMDKLTVEHWQKCQCFLSALIMNMVNKLRIANENDGQSVHLHPLRLSYSRKVPTKFTGTGFLSREK